MLSAPFVQTLTTGAVSSPGGRHTRSIERPPIRTCKKTSCRHRHPTRQMGWTIFSASDIHSCSISRHLLLRWTLVLATLMFLF